MLSSQNQARFHLTLSPMLGVAFFTALLGASLQVRAENQSTTTPYNNTTTTTPSESGLLQLKKYKADEEITDPKLKADAGSLSQYSAKFSLTYYGPPVGNLGQKDQPNPDGRVSANQTAISGTVGGQYRMTSKDSLSAGTGIKGIYPAQGFDGVETNTPYFSYSHITKWHGLQIRQTPEVDIETAKNYTAIGEDYGTGYTLSSVYDLGTSRMAVGLDFGLFYYHFKDGYPPVAKVKGNNGSAYFYPNFKYNFNDRTQFMTSWTVGWITPRDTNTNPHQNMTFWDPATVKQSIGVSYSFTRDIYIYPNFTFYPSRLAADSTTINISTIFSLL